MNLSPALKGLCFTATLLASATLFAEDQQQTRSRMQDRLQQETQTRDRSQIYGSQLMSPEERTQYREKMRNMKTQEERQAYRQEHHRMMQERAREKGLDLPDSPPEQGMGVGPGGGMGPGGGKHRSRQ